MKTGGEEEDSGGMEHEDEEEWLPSYHKTPGGQGISGEMEEDVPVGRWRRQANKPENGKRTHKGWKRI